MHLLIDGFGGDNRKMTDESFIYSFLDDYPNQIDMNKITEPKVTRYMGSKKEDWGISGFVMIAESHISIHTFPEREYVNIDIFSCKDFDDKKAIGKIKEAFSLDKIKVWVIDRGLDQSIPDFSGNLEVGRAREYVVEI
jgi:S-adenosylmethionine decarboxylase